MMHRRALAVLSSIVSAAGMVVAFAPAVAASTITEVTPASWAYIDSAAPGTSFPNPAGNAPVGAATFADGINHVSKSYFTFSLSALRGNRFISAFVSADETAVVNCSNPRATQAWLTGPASRPTWNNQPPELVRLGGPFLNSSCPARNVTWNATAAVQSALDAGRSTATIVLRLPDEQQADPQFAREYSPALRMTVTYNRAPAKAAGLTVNDKPCTAEPIPVGPGSARVAAVVTDPDDTFLSAEFALWPAGHPEQSVTFTNDGSLVGDRYWAAIDRFLTDGVTYAWRARGRDNLDTGPWSSVCRLITDFTRPTTTPTVTSADYNTDAPPGSGGTGIPGLFTFSANGDRDITGFFYGEFEAHTFVAADRPGGQASIRHVPQRSGPLSMAVRGVDAAGNPSPTIQYRFWVASNEPGITCAPFDGFVGQPRQCTFTPTGSGGVTGYVYRINEDPELTVAAGPDGTATVTVVPTDFERLDSEVFVRARLTTGNLTGDSQTVLLVDPAAPTIDEPEQPMMAAPARFVVHPVLPGSVSVTYIVGDEPRATVPVGPDGTAIITVTPTQSGFLSFLAFTTTDTGIRSGWTGATVNVASNRPAVTSAEYPESQFSGAVGIPGTFVFSSPVPGVLSYTYTFNQQAPVTVPATADGTASVVITPTEPQFQLLTVTSRLAGGVDSESRDYIFFVTPNQPQVSCDADDGIFVRPGQQLHCSVRPSQENVVSWGYAIGSGSDISIPAQADGTATFEFTIPADQPGGTQVRFRVWSVNSDGLRSDETIIHFTVSRPAAGG